MNLSVDFPLILIFLVFLSGIIALLDLLFFAKRRQQAGKKQPKTVEYARSFFPVLLLVLLIRSFIGQPYRVPTGSLEPTVIPGDFIAVSQFSYGLRLPVTHTKILNIGEPKLGDIALFRWPVNPARIFVKRVIGVPGDHVVYKNKVLTINGKTMPQKLLGTALDIEPGYKTVSVLRKQEDLMGHKHQIFVHKHGGLPRNFDVVVPKGMYFMMGDNRDNSDDSRAWGFVPESALIGKAYLVFFSWNSAKHDVRWRRIGTVL